MFITFHAIVFERQPSKSKTAGTKTELNMK